MNLENTEKSKKNKNAKGHILYYYIYMKCSEQENPQKRKISGCQGLGLGGREGKGEVNANVQGISFWCDETILELDSGNECTLEEMEQPSWSTKESESQYLDTISKMTE